MIHQYSDLEAEQRNCIEFINMGEDSLIAADVGTGKTVIGLTAAHNALQSGDVSRWLILAPKLVATDTWAQESAQWSHLDNDAVAIACGNEKQRLEALQSDCPIVVTNYENLQWLLKQYPRPSKYDDPLPFDGLMCDEIDKLKSVSSKRFKDFRNRVKVFNKRVGLTGTLVPNNLTEVWGQTYMIDGGETFGRSFYAWRKDNFYPTDYKQYNWAPFPDTREKILESLTGLAFRLPAKGLPIVHNLAPVKLTLPAIVRSRYDELEEEFLLIIEDKKKNKRRVDAANEAVLVGKLQQICAGFSYVDRSKEAVWHSYEKFDCLDNLCGPNGLGEQVLVFYHFREELDELKRRYPGLHYLGGGVSNSAARSAIQKWNAGELPMLALHPASAGHGLNLQKSGVHRIAFLTLPWSGGMYKQVTGRLARRGQTAKKIYTHTALFTDTIDEDVYGTVTGKLSGMEDFLDDLYALTRVSGKT